MSSYATELLWRQLLARNGYHYVNVPIDTSRGPVLVMITHGTTMTCIDTALNTVFQDPIPSGMSMVQPVGDSNVSSRPLTQVQPQPIRDSGMLRNSMSLNRRLSVDMMDTDFYGSTDSSIDFRSNVSTGSSIDSRSSLSTVRYVRPMKQKKPVGGLDIITAEELIAETVYTPTKFDSDAYFFDSLYLSLQEDILLNGANGLDDYLNNKRDARMRIYLDAALDNQGCGCEHGNLDTYLRLNKHALSAVALRATLSEECKRTIYQPADTKSVQKQLDSMESAMKDWCRQFRKAHDTGDTDETNLWRTYNDSEDYVAIN